MKPVTVAIARIQSAAHLAGSHWFERPTLSFFSSTTASRAYLSACGKYAYFWSCEKTGFTSREYRYSVRCARMEGEFIISTAGSFLAWPSGYAAGAEARRLARGGAHAATCNCPRCYDAKYPAEVAA